jgi:hypothetical protein
MKKYKVEIDTQVKGQKQVDKLNESLEETTEQQDEVNEGFSGMGSAADGAVGGAVGKFAALKTAIGSSIKSLGVLKVAVAATGLGLLLLTIASIKAAFTSTEAGQNKFAKLMAALGVITGNLTDLLAGLGNTIISAFENPVQAMKDFWEALKNNILVRINSTIDMFGLLGKAIMQVFEGDFSGAMDSAKEASLKFVDSMTGIEDTVGKATEAVTGFIEETKKEIEISNELSDAQADLDKKVRAQLIKRAKLEGEVADARLKALDEEQFSLQERIDLLEEAGDKTEEIFEGEVEIAKERLRQVQERNKLSGSTKADLDEEAQLQSDLIRLEKEKADAQKRVFASAQTLRKQDAAEKAAIIKAEIAAEKAKNDKIAKDKKEALEKEIKERQERVKLALEEEARLWANLFASMDNAGQQWLSTLTKGIKTAMTEIEDTGKLSTEGIMAVTAAGLKAGAQLVSKIASMIDTSTKEGFEKQKKLRIAGALMDSFGAAIAGMLAGLSVGGPFGIILGAITAAASLAFGLVQVANIKKQQFGGGGGSSGGGGSAPRLQASTASPSFSSIAPATGGEQGISNALNQDNEIPPTQAFVVSEQVESGSALDRNIKANATV